MDFKALFIKVESIIFRLPFLRSPIIVCVFFFLILAILLPQIKLKVTLFTCSQKFLGTGSTDEL